MNKSELLKSFYSAAGLLCEPLWTAMGGLNDEVRMTCEEIRLRVDRPMELICCGKSVIPDRCRIVRPGDLEDTLRRCTGNSVHTYLPQLCKGFATARGGHRFGICGEAIRTGGAVTGFRNITSLNIRIARQLVGIADPLTARLLERPKKSLLVVSGPGVGKTTLLRDLARGLSLHLHVAIADSRYELAGVSEGRPCFRIGNCDVMSGVEPGDALEMLIRTMSPEYLVMDEITGRRELDALQSAAFAGVSMLASCHAACPEELRQREIYRPLLTGGLFQMLVFIVQREGRRCYLLYEEVPDAADGCVPADACCLYGHIFRKTADICPESVVG